MTNDSLIGKQLANFRVERLLGRGGMAEVYFGEDVNLQRPVAIKVINTYIRNNANYADRFISEARAVATWRHENIVQVYYAGQSADLYYFVMEYIDGMDLDLLLHQYAEDGELIPHADVIRIGKAVAAALDYAHKRNVIHRDVKPANVMLSSEGRVVLMDFGLALDMQQGSMGEVLGTPHYVSPEQARRSADAVPQSDVYSLGVMLFEMLTGVVPFDDDSPTSVALQHLQMTPPSPRSLNRNLNQQVEDVLLKALSKKPEKRYQSATALANALEQALSQKASAIATAELPPLPPGMTPPNRPVSRRTVTQRVALHARETMIGTTYPGTPQIGGLQGAESAIPSPQTAAPIKKKSFSLKRVLVRFVLILLLIAAGIGVFIITNEDGPAIANTVLDAISASINDQVAVAAKATETKNPTSTDSPSTATTVPDTATDDPPTLTPTAAATSDSAATMSDRPTATVLYPDGRLIQLLWNENSFYWYNPTNKSISVSSISFKALDDDGNALPYTFGGRRWTVGFNVVESGKCVALEMFQNPMPQHLNPSVCRAYNSIIEPGTSSDEVFWLARDNAVEFRVLWDGKEVGRCMIADETCNIYIPK